MDENEIRAALDRHWAASDQNDFDAEHEIYRDDALLEYPQSGERTVREATEPNRRPSLHCGGDKQKAGVAAGFTEICDAAETLTPRRRASSA